MNGPVALPESCLCGGTLLPSFATLSSLTLDRPCRAGISQYASSAALCILWTQCSFAYLLPPPPNAVKFGAYETAKCATAKTFS